MDGLRLINVHFKSCMYQILTSMGRLKKVRRLTKKEITCSKLTPTNQHIISHCGPK
jgi:hypothetical protein